MKVRNLKWLLYGEGFENLGRNGLPEESVIEDIGPDQVLLRIDAVSLCFSDVKVVTMGNRHPRLGNRDLRVHPVVLGHEFSVTVVEAGAERQAAFRAGDRFVVQPDIYFKGEPKTLGYVLEGALQQYMVAGKEILESDEGCALLPLQRDTGSSEAALCEPWSCVEASYHIPYRKAMKNGGVAWFIRADRAQSDSYSLDGLFEVDCRPSKVVVSGAGRKLQRDLRECSAKYGFPLIESDPNGLVFDDIIILGTPEPKLIESSSSKLANGGILAIVSDTPVGTKVHIDVGRIHYDGILFTGTTGNDISRAYREGVDAGLRGNSAAWFVGAGGPMGQMHVQRACGIPGGPLGILATDIDTARINTVASRFGPLAESRGATLVAVNPQDARVRWENCLSQTAPEGTYGNIVVLAPSAKLIEECSDRLSSEGVLNIFAGIPKGTKANLDISGCYLKGQRWVGNSGTSTHFMLDILRKIEIKKLDTNYSVAAIGGLRAALEGLKGVKSGAFPGKVVIYPHLTELSLLSMDALAQSLPAVAARLADGIHWTRDAEMELFKETKQSGKSG
jgi:threonine dehydrogenase-like Zn-dependent dehydrogenase